MSERAQSGGLPSLAVVWGQFGPYHRDRCEGAALRLRGLYRVVGMEIAQGNALYAWADVSSGENFEKITLIPGKTWQQTSWWQRFTALRDGMRREDVSVAFLCHYDQIEIFLLACWLRLTGRKVFGMHESKFDDRPRALWRETIKAILCLPYNGQLAGGARTRLYLRFLGVPDRKIAFGYDSVSMDRVRRLAAAPPAPEGAPFAERHFSIVARLVEKKNLFLAIAAYDLYRKAAGPSARQLVLLGNGPLEAELRADVARRGLDGVVFAGFVQEEAVAKALATSLALILPSTEEQWGLVVNEAIFMGLPILCSDNVGSRDDLVRTAVNGYVFEPDNAEGLAYFMTRIGADEAEWRRLCEGSLARAPLGDTARFGDGVARLLQAPPVGANDAP